MPQTIDWEKVERFEFGVIRKPVVAATDFDAAVRELRITKLALKFATQDETIRQASDCIEAAKTELEGRG